MFIFRIQGYRMKLGRSYRPIANRVKVRLGLRWVLIKKKRGVPAVVYRKKVWYLRFRKNSVSLRAGSKRKRITIRRRFSRKKYLRKLQRLRRRRKQRKRRRRNRRRRRRRTRRKRRRQRRQRRKARRRRLRRGRLVSCVLKLKYARRWRRVYRQGRYLVFRIGRRVLKVR